MTLISVRKSLMKDPQLERLQSSLAEAVDAAVDEIRSMVPMLATLPGGELHTLESPTLPAPWAISHSLGRVPAGAFIANVRSVSGILTTVPQIFRLDGDIWDAQTATVRLTTASHALTSISIWVF